MSFRKSVTYKLDKVWTNNSNKDLFTGWWRRKLEDEHHPHVDHIVECQLGEHIWNQALDGRMTTRTRLAKVTKLWNDVDNLNVTTNWLNQRKGDAFERWLKGQDDDLRSALVYYNVASNQRTKIVVAFEDAQRWLADELDDLAEDSGLDLYADISCELEHWLGKTG
uniref:Uncharacterized protein n=1 Tax=Chlamydomonas euryale TaxID=1486919 RepID=A0A7R9VYF7_9CHLO|mmetsp:Transcript_6376/g.19777  ORF Transcript_6376/g.19777 Transcript_6376/m.19777 type:complete len:166 (+) Transcript_6376:380-877(+)